MQGPCRSEDPPLIAKILEPAQRREAPADVAVRGPPDFQSEPNLTLLCFWPVAELSPTQPLMAAFDQKPNFCVCINIGLFMSESDSICRCIKFMSQLYDCRDHSVQT